MAGWLAVETMLLRIGMSDQRSEGLSELEIRLLRSFFQRLTDKELNYLCHRWIRTLVLALQRTANNLVEELAVRTIYVNTSYAEDKTTLSPLEVSCVYPYEFNIFEILASRCEDLSKRNAAGNTLVHLSGIHNHVDILE